MNVIVQYLNIFLPNNDVFFLKKPFQCIFKTISAVTATGQTVSFYAIETKVATNARHQNESIYIFFVKGGQTAVATEAQVTLFYVKPNSIIHLCCVWKFVYVVYDIFWLLFLSILCMTLSLTSNFSIYYMMHFIFFSFKKKYLS